ncbi:phosphoesterase [Spirochaetia bacterium]|nr:phosphoesterase [Spirochaetia bacterium]
MPVPVALINFIAGASRFLVVGHEDPDGDCVGSQLALCSVLQRLSKESIPCSAGPFRRPEIISFQDRFRPIPSELSGIHVLVVDCSTLDRVGNIGPMLKGLPVAIIDHHATGHHETGSVPAFVDSASPSTTLLVLSLIESLNVQPTLEEAELLLFGLCTDTGFFRHLDANSGATFDASARLIRSGANLKHIYQMINPSRNLNSRLLLGRILSRTQAYYGGKLLVTSETLEEGIQFGVENRDSDKVYSLLQSVHEVEAIVLIRQENPEKCSVGFRSLDIVNVAEVAVRFGGGGHKNASGASIPGTIEQVTAQILAAFKDIFIGSESGQ